MQHEVGGAVETIIRKSEYNVIHGDQSCGSPASLCCFSGKLKPHHLLGILIALAPGPVSSLCRLAGTLSGLCRGSSLTAALMPPHGACDAVEGDVVGRQMGVAQTLALLLCQPGIRQEKERLVKTATEKQRPMRLLSLTDWRRRLPYASSSSLLLLPDRVLIRDESLITFIPIQRCLLQDISLQ